MKTTGILMENIRIALETAEEDGYRRGLGDGFVAVMGAKGISTADKGPGPASKENAPRKTARELIHEYKVVGFDVCNRGDRSGHSSACNDLVELLERYAAQERSSAPTE